MAYQNNILDISKHLTPELTGASAGIHFPNILLMMEAMLSSVRFNELLDFVRRDHSSLPEPSRLIVSLNIPTAAWRFI